MEIKAQVEMLKFKVKTLQEDETRTLEFTKQMEKEKRQLEIENQELLLENQRLNALIRVIKECMNKYDF